ncbi:MAG: hypothetical protein SNJ73_02005 [Acetobacteraceae bacterium]
MTGGLFAPEGGWVVLIRDLSAEGDESAVEEVRGFATLMHANAFARAYVRDSVERCRVAGATPEEVAADWHAFGEDAVVADAGAHGWSSVAELAFFAHTPAPEGSAERDWRSLDPRRLEHAPQGA